MDNNEIYHNAESESNDIDAYRRKCSYKISEFKTKIEEKNFSLPGDSNSVLLCDVVLKNKSAEINNEEDVQISAEFLSSSFKEDKKKVSFQGPSLFSTCTISISKEEDYEREFGYIQTSKRFFENEFENAIVFSDFHANLMHNQDEVLDSDGENSPFYSTKSYCEVPAGKIKCPTTTIKFTDKPGCNILKNADNESSKTPPKHNGRCLKKHERYQQFFVYLVMRSMKNNGKWKYDVLFSFDWFIYLKFIKVTGENNNIFEYNCGLNEHTTTRVLPDWINSNEFYTCNDDQFSYWIDKIDCNFNIDKIPKSISKNKLERIYYKMEIMISKKKSGFENCKNRISNANKLYGNNEFGDLEDENDGSIENMGVEKKKKKIYSKENESYEATECLLPKVRILCEGLEKMDLEKIKFLENTINIDMDVKKLDNCIEMKRSIDEFCGDTGRLLLEVKNKSKSLKKMHTEVDKLCENIGIVYLESKEFRENLTNIELEIRKLYDCIEMIYLREHEVSNRFKKLILRDNLPTKFEKMDLEKNEFSGDFTNSDEKIKKSLQSTDRVSLKKLKEVIKVSIDFGKYKICKCRFLAKNEFLYKIRKAVIERNNKEKIDFANKQDKQSISKNNEGIIEINNKENNTFANNQI